MSFPWYDANIPKAFVETFPMKAEASLAQELIERARLLRGLLYSRERTRLRLRQNMSWEYEGLSVAAKIEAEDAAVERVYSVGHADPKS